MIAINSRYGNYPKLTHVKPIKNDTLCILTFHCVNNWKKNIALNVKVRFYCEVTDFLLGENRLTNKIRPLYIVSPFRR